MKAGRYGFGAAAGAGFPGGVTGGGNTAVTYVGVGRRARMGPDGRGGGRIHQASADISLLRVTYASTAAEISMTLSP